MNKYVLQGDYPLRFGKKTYEPGDTVEMSAGRAAYLVESGRLVESANLGPENPEDRLDAIVGAIAEFKKDSPDHFTKGGMPKVPALEAALGWPVTGMERDTAWKAIEDAKGDDK